MVGAILLPIKVFTKKQKKNHQWIHSLQRSESKKETRTLGNRLLKKLIIFVHKTTSMILKQIYKKKHFVENPFWSSGIAC